MSVQDHDRSRHHRPLAAALFVLLAAAGYFLVIDSARGELNQIRLERSFVLAAGESIYPDPETGPVLLSLYPPVGAVAYLPATVMRQPAAAGIAGQLLSIAFTLLPVLWLHWTARRKSGADGVFGFLIFAALSSAVGPLVYVTYSVHVDAPTLGLGAVACGLLGHGPEPQRGWRAWTAAACSVLAVWSKQMMVALPPTLLLYVLLVRGRRAGWRFFLALAASSLGITLLVVLLFGPPENLFFQIWTLPSRHPLAGSVAAALVRLGIETAPVWLLWLAALGWRLLRRRPGWTGDAAVLHGMVGLAMVPLAILAYRKVGGDINALSYVAYFLLAGATLSLAEQAGREAAVARNLRRVAASVTLVALLRIPWALPSWNQPPRLEEQSCQTAFVYAKKHPGRIYFPDLTLSSLLAEGQVYHSGTGLWERELAGLPVGERQLRAHLPARLEGIAYDASRLTAEERAFFRRPGAYLPELSRISEDPELPGFVVFRQD